MRSDGMKSFLARSARKRARGLKVRLGGVEGLVDVVVEVCKKVLLVAAL